MIGVHARWRRWWVPFFLVKALTFDADPRRRTKGSMMDGDIPFQCYSWFDSLDGLMDGGSPLI